jgi:PAS domain S-box-containing protein
MVRYSVLFIFLPVVGILGWLIVERWLTLITPVIYIGVLQVMMAIVVITVALGQVRTRRPSEREQVLEASQEQFLSLYERSPVPYVTLDGRGLIVMYNLAAVRLFRTTTEGLLGTNLVDRFTLEDQGELSVILGKITNNYTIADEEVQVITIDGSTRWVLLSVFVYDDADQRLVSLVDITHQKQVDSAKSEFVALATHQLRTPLAALRWNVELLGKRLLQRGVKEEYEYLQKIERNVLRMIALINDFLSASKLENGTFSTSLTNIEVHQFIDSVVEEYAPTIAEKQIQVIRINEPPSLTLTTDTRLFHIIVSNLLSNALKYTRAQGVVQLQYQRVGKKIMLTVADSGIGIPIDEQAQLFSKFFRARNAQLERAEGTGLGLYIVKQSAEKLGGSIEFVSRENEGTRFVVTLPYTV